MVHFYHFLKLFMSESHMSVVPPPEARGPIASNRSNRRQAGPGFVYFLPRFKHKRHVNTSWKILSSVQLAFDNLQSFCSAKNASNIDTFLYVSPDDIHDAAVRVHSRTVRENS